MQFGMLVRFAGSDKSEYRTYVTTSDEDPVAVLQDFVQACANRVVLVEDRAGHRDYGRQFIVEALV